MAPRDPLATEQIEAARAEDDAPAEDVVTLRGAQAAAWRRLVQAATKAHACQTAATVAAGELRAAIADACGAVTG